MSLSPRAQRRKSVACCPQGKIIINRNYRGDVPMTVAERFANYIAETEEEDLRPVRCPQPASRSCWPTVTVNSRQAAQQRVARAGLCPGHRVAPPESDTNSAVVADFAALLAGGP